MDKQIKDNKSLKILAFSLPVKSLTAFALIVETALAVVVGFSDTLQPELKTVLVVFLVALPISGVTAFGWIFYRRPEALSAPSDFSDDDIALSEPLEPEKVSLYNDVDVFYATDRNIQGGENPSSYYGSKISELSFGIARVSIPTTHRPGRLESPSIIRIEIKPDPQRHVLLLSIQPLSKNQWVDQIKTIDNESALLFIHGYNVSFENAARRTAQLKWDLGFGGPAILYSWPSKGVVKGYVADEETIQLTTKNLSKVLQFLQNNTEIKNLHVIAHSMGSRAIVNALNDYAVRNADLPINQIILAAPDINANIFCEEIAPNFSDSTTKFSVYASSNDKALKASKKIHTYSRIGESGENLFLLDGIETIDASKVETDFLGHGYFAESKQVIDDIFLAIQHGLPASGRNLRKRKRGKQSYWEFP